MVEKHNRIAAQAIENFVDTIIDSYLSGFIDCNKFNFIELHRVAENHIDHNYNRKIKNVRAKYDDNQLHALSVGEGIN